MMIQEPLINSQMAVEEQVLQKDAHPLEESSWSTLTGVLSRHRWMILSLMLAGAVLGTLYGLSQKPAYTAQALVMLNVDKGNATNLEDLNPTSPGSSEQDLRLETEVRVLQSDTLGLEVIKQLHLDSSPDFPPATASAPTNTAENRLLITWHNRLSVRIIPKTKLIEIRFTSTNPNTAADAVNALLAAYVSRAQQVRTSASDDATRWLGGQAAASRERAENAERALADYQKSGGIILLPGGDGSQNAILSRIADLNRAYTTAQVARISKEAHYRNVQSKDPEVLASLAQDSTIAGLRAQQSVLAAEVAQANAKFGPEYPRVKQLHSAMQQIDQTIGIEVQRAVDQVREEYTSAVKTEASLKSQLDEAKAEAFKVSEGTTQLQLRQQEATSSRQLYENLMRHFNETGAVAGLQAGTIQVVDQARVPSQPSGTGRRVYALSGLVLGLFLGLTAAIARNAAADPVGGGAEAQEISGIPVLGGVPLIEGHLSSDTVDKPAQIALQKPRSKAAEAFRTLRTSLQLSTHGTSPQVIAVTSPMPGEGKSFTAMNLAIVLAQRGASVLLIDADMRRGTQHENAGIPLSPGLTGVLTGVSDLRSAIRLLNGDAQVAVLPAGPPPPLPGDLLDRAAMAELLDQCKALYDFVLIDTSCVLLVSDALIVARLSDGVLLVARSGVTARRSLARAAQLLAPVRSKLLGLVLNADPELSRSNKRESSYFNYYEEAK